MKNPFAVWLSALFALSLFASGQAAPPTVKSEPAPTATVEAKLAYRDAQHKLEAVEKQMASLDSQFQKLQTQAKDQYAQLQEQQKKAQSEVDAAQAVLLKSANADPAKFDVDGESLSIRPKPAPPTKAQAAPPVPAEKK